MFDRFECAREDLRRAVSELDPELIDAGTAKRLIESLAEMERLVAAATTLCVRRITRTPVWSGSGDRSAAHWLARTTGSTVGAAVTVVETARRVASLPETEQVLRAGALSSTQITEIAAAASADPLAETELLETARRDGIRGLREACRRVQAAAAGADERERYDRIHRSRYLRHWTDHDGAFRVDARLTPDAGAALVAALEPRRQRRLGATRAAGRVERTEACAADALVELAESGADTTSTPRRPVPRATIHVRVDHRAFVRGHLAPGETCEIAGIGPVPVSVARELADDALLSLFVTDGTDVRAIVRTDRTIPVALRAALEARDPTCVIEGCPEHERLEIDHVVPFAEGGPTTIDNLARLCHWHHYLKTHRGFRLEGTTGRPRRLLDPDPP